MRKPWDAYFMEQARMVATRATCDRLHVGALIVREKRIIATGYNGSIAGDEHCNDMGCLLKDGHCIRTIHAESNAILQCAKFGVATEGAAMYVTHFPCLQCTKQIIQAGIQCVYYGDPYRIDPYALDLIDRARIRLNELVNV